MTIELPLIEQHVLYKKDHLCVGACLDKGLDKVTVAFLRCDVQWRVAFFPARREKQRPKMGRQSIK